jgi:Ni,Fe-hydrogenase maturation factor
MRGDDAAAFGLPETIGAQALRGVLIRRTRAVSPDDFLDVEAEDLCVVADAVMGVEAGRVLSVPLGEILDGADFGSVSSHTLPLRDALRIASSVLGRGVRGRFVGIGATEFGVGSGLSASVVGGMAAFGAAVTEALGSRAAEDA